MFEDHESPNFRQRATASKASGVIATTMLMTLLGCSNPNDSRPERSGMAVLNINVSALSAAEITALVVTVSGAGISPDIVTELPEAPEDEWRGTIENIPIGTERTFFAEAFDTNGSVIYSGTATGVTIEEDNTVSIDIYLQQTAPPVPFENAVPVITAFTVSPMSIVPGGEVALVIEATDPDFDDTLAFLWEAEEGHLDTLSAVSTIWTAPMVPGTYVVGVSVSDPHGATATASVSIPVSSGTGDADIDIIVNTSPDILGVIPTPTRIGEGESVSLDLTVTDAEADSLSFAWSADCDGTFDDNTIEDPTFTLNTLLGERCTITVVIADGAGGANQGVITISTGVPVTPSEPPPPGCEGAIEFPDPVLEEAVRSRIGKPTGDIYFEDLVSLTSFATINKGVADLSGMQCMTQITALALQTNNIRDISPLANLTFLEYLSIGSNAISDVSPLSNLIMLNTLYLYNNNISDISALSNLTNLTALEIGGNDISDISALSNLSNLSYVLLQSNNISDLSPLSVLVNLSGINLDSNAISDISAVTRLTKLTHLYLGSNNISDISPMSSLTQLTTLDLNANAISDISVLANLTSLRLLRLGENNISDITPLVRNSGLATGDEVQLRNNLLDCEDSTVQNDISALEARGVDLDHDCE